MYKSPVLGKKFDLIPEMNAFPMNNYLKWEQNIRNIEA